MARLTTLLGVTKGLRFAAGLFLFMAPVASPAGDYLLSPETFLSQAFGNDVPTPSLAWLTGDRGDAVEKLLGRKPPSLRVRYWRSGERSAWILEDIGKEKRITAGFVVEHGKLADVKVLAFRESRGWEIKHDFFTDQFNGVGLTADRELARSIDNITGATLSVNAMQRMARVALFLADEVTRGAP